jgi:hypothetical protein
MDDMENMDNVDTVHPQFDTPRDFTKQPNENIDIEDPFKAASSEFEQAEDNKSTSQQMHTPSSGAVFKMDDFESVFSQSKNLNQVEARNEILPQQGGSKMGTTDDEDFFSTSSQPQNPLFSPAPELFEQKDSPEVAKENDISKVDEVDIKQEESQSQIDNSITNPLTIETNPDDTTPF